MSPPERLIRNVSDTARWIAAYRARESERKDALFKDPYARRLAGERGEAIARAMMRGMDSSWALVVRTVVLDQVVERAVAGGVDTVVNLAAGFDTRPYRMKLPASLRWFEVDMPELLTEKEQILAGEQPVCVLERVKLDLSDVEKRRALFARLGAEAKKALVISEGLLMYLTAGDVAALAKDLAATPHFDLWTFDLFSPGLLRMLSKLWTSELGNAPMRFGPEEGPAFFEPYGWRPIEIHSQVKAAGRLKRGSLSIRVAALLPEPRNGRAGNVPWLGVCLMGRK